MASWSVLEPVPGLTIHIAATNEGLCLLSMQKPADEFLADLRRDFPLFEWWRDDDHPILAEARRQLSGYFRGELAVFELPLAMNGTTFQKRVWKALRGIPYGETRSYRDIAESIGSPRATRAVGAANGRNPVAIIVPCHRVIAADGSLGGYSGGLRTKRLLLDHEGRKASRYASAAAAG